MYSTCLFCNNALGTNEAIEHFPVGKRLAYDEATGRLWVVCRKCDRWNLSPLESRWEAIEDAERLFRATKTRVATDNIGLARLSDGTELVRVGAPPRIELAVWRYGDQFRKRYRKHLITTTGGVIVFSGAVLFAGGPLHSANLIVSSVVGVALSAGAAAGKGMIEQKFKRWYNHAIPQVGVRNDEEKLLRLTQDNIDQARLAVADDEQWQLSVPHVITKRAERWARLLRRQEETFAVQEPSVIHGPAALQALAMLLPRANREGANEEGVAAALKTIDETSNLAALLRLASDERVAQAKKFALRVSGRNVSDAPAHVRLALEMSLHADDERRAMEGELRELEQRWKDADAIAKISDGLLLPDTVDGRLQALHEQRRDGDTNGM